MSANAASGATILDRIVEARRADIQHRKPMLPMAALRMAVKKAAAARDFAAALARPGLNVIAELKRASPSRGVLREVYEPGVIAEEYEVAGAAAISVLTEEQFFQGSMAHLRAVRKAAALPVLRKDFIVDPWQVWETRAAEADSFLLIAAVLDDAMLGELMALGRDLGMEPLVEVHSREELQRSVAADARIVGVNNRDLRTFEVRLETSLELVGEIPDACVAVSESGLRAGADLARLRAAGFDAFLIGEHLMSAPDPGEALRELLRA